MPAQFTVVGDLAAYIAAARSTPLAAPEREAALKCIVDLLPAVAVGLDDPGPASIRKTAPAIYGQGKNPIWFTGQTGTLLGAAWANSAAAAALDLDDGNRFARGHPGAAIIPAAFAVAHETGASLEDILKAIVIGYEVGVAVGAARTSYGSSGTWIPFGVVAAAAALRKTPRDQIEQALAIAGESAPNQLFAGGPAPRNPHPEGSAIKEGIPWGTVTGLTALFLAEAGHTGPRNILDSARHYRFAEDLELGADPHICKTYFKPYACCRHIHAPIAALLDLMETHGIDGHQIETMAVDIHAAGLRISNRPSPQNLVDIQYSIPYCLALVALHGAQTLVPVTSEALMLKGSAELAEKVSLKLDPELDAIYPEDIRACVTVTANGKHYVSEPTPPKGEPLMSWEDLEDKFKIATRLIASHDRQDRVLDAIARLRTGDLSALTACLSGIRLSTK